MPGGGHRRLLQHRHVLPRAAQRVKADIESWLAQGQRQDPGQLHVLVVDSCGEKRHQDVFGVNVSQWTQVRVFPNWNCGLEHKERLEGYLAWSLRNVLQRAKCSPGCGYWLNPRDGLDGLGLCVKVHRAKARAHFGNKKCPDLFAGGGGPLPATIEGAIALLQPAADSYAATLEKEDEPDFGQLFVE